MMTHKAKRRTGLALALLLALSFVVPAIADQPPRIPAGFYGTVQINGEYVTDGTIVSAWINDVQYAETTTFTTTINSEQVSVYTLEVPGDDPSTPEIEGGEEGDPIIFKVDGHDADQGGTWHEGTDTELNLHATVNYAPTTVSVSPSGYSSQPNYLRRFEARYEDPNGWQDLANVYLMWNLSTSDNTQQVRYEVATNLVYIRNDANSEWVGGFIPGTDVRISNTHLTLDVAQTSVVTTTTQVRVTWGMYPKQPMTSVNWNQYLKAEDSALESTGWVNHGTWRINMFANVGGISPASGSAPAGTPQTFTTTYSDEDGADTMVNAYILGVPQGQSLPSWQLYAYWNSTANKMYLHNGTAWSEGRTPGVPGTLENDWVILDVGNSSVSANGKVLTINWSVTFKAGTEGTKDMYAYIYDNQWFQDGWSLLGNWTVGSGAAASAPGATILPLEMPDPVPQDAPADFKPVYRSPELDPDSRLSGMMKPNYFQSPNLEGMPSENVVVSPARRKGNLQFPATAPVKKAAPSSMPSAGILSPETGNRAPGWGWNFRTQFSDPSGYAHLSQVYVLFSLDGSTENAIYLRYDQDANKVYLRDSADTHWIGGVTPGSDVLLSNANGSLDVSLTRTATYAGTYLDVYWQVVFKSTGSSQHYRIFMKAEDEDSNILDWVEKGWHRVNMWAATGGMTPSSSVHAIGETKTYTTTYTDIEGWDDLQYAYLYMRESFGGTDEAVYARYMVDTNEISLYDDATSSWLPPITPGAAQNAENNWVIIHGAGCSAITQGNQLSLVWSIEFKPAMPATAKGAYMYANDQLLWVSGWQYAGQVQVTN